VKSSREKPKWFHVHVGFKQKFDHPEKTSLPVLRKHGENFGPLVGMQLLHQSRLSVTKVSEEEWNYILDLAGHTEYKTEIEEPENSIVDSTMFSVDESILPHKAKETVESAKFLNEVIEDVAEEVAEQTAEELDERNHLTSETMLEQLTDTVADQITDQLADAIENGIVAAEDVTSSTKVTAEVDFGKCFPHYLNQRNANVSSIVVESIVPSTEDLSELPDAPVDSSLLLPIVDESLDQIGQLPSDGAIRQPSPVKRVASRRSSRAPSLPRSRRSSRAPSLPATGITPAATKSFNSLVPPATVPAKVAARQVRVDAGPESDPAFVQDVDDALVDDSFLPGDDSLVDDTFAEVHIGANGHADDGSGRVGRTYGGEFEYGDSSLLEL
jgi:EVE domain